MLGKELVTICSHSRTTTTVVVLQTQLLIVIKDFLLLYTSLGKVLI